MIDWILSLIPNVIDYWDGYLLSIRETLQMFVFSGIISFALGIFFGVIYVVTKPGNIFENKIVYWVLDKVINVFRSIPFIILIIAIIPITRMMVGTAIGVKGAIFPLVLGCVPFFTKQVDMALSSVNPGVIEAAESMGASRMEIIFRVYLKESIPALARSTTITAVSLIGLTAMGGAVGAGGIGAFVIRYGQGKYLYDLIIFCIITILVMVTIIQFIGDLIIKKTTH